MITIPTMRMAELVATRSTCLRRNVGAVGLEKRGLDHRLAKWRSQRNGALRSGRLCEDEQSHRIRNPA